MSTRSIESVCVYCGSSGRRVVGVIPDTLVDREVAHEALSELYVVSTMHERKQKMADLSDMFIAMPGGVGTLEELFEVLTWGQLGIHGKECGLLNTRGYRDLLLSFLEYSVTEGFIGSERLKALAVESDPAALLARLGV